MRPISEDFKAALGASHQRITVATCILPSSEVINLKLRPGASISAKRGTGSQRSISSLSIAPQPGVDLFELLSTPLAVFHIEHGINFGAGHVETVPVFHGEAATGSMKIDAGDISLACVDMWARIEGSAFREPFVPAAGTRASQISAAITSAIPGAVVKVINDGGTSTIAGVWSGSRAAYITKLATDGKLEVAPDANGDWIIRTTPVITSPATSWIFRTGPAGNIKRDTATRSKPFNKVYNTVVAVPSNDSQSWARQEVTLSDTNDPRHWTKIGVRAYEYRSPTIMTGADAKAAIEAVLQQLLRATESIVLGTVSNPALEPGDTLTIAHDRTDTDPGLAATQLLDSFDLQLDDGTMSTSSSDASMYPLVSV